MPGLRTLLFVPPTLIVLAGCSTVPLQRAELLDEPVYSAERVLAYYI